MPQDLDLYPLDLTAISRLAVKLIALPFLIALNGISVYSLAQVSPPRDPLKQSAQTQTAQYALFWSEGSTWIVDTRSGVLFQAPTLLAAGPEGAVFEYRINTHTQRIKPELPNGQPQHLQRPFGYLYRWTTFDRYLLRGAHQETLTSHYPASEVQYEVHDEHQVLQFTGDHVTLIRWFSHGRVTPNNPIAVSERNTSIYTMNLKRGHYVAEVDFAPQVLALTRQLYPQLIPSCLNVERGLIHWQIGGQRDIFWLSLSPQESPSIDPVNSPCPSGLSALRISTPPPRKKAQNLSWEGETLYHHSEALYGGVVDALLDPRGQVALTLEGPPRRDEQLYIDQVGGFFENSVSRYLSMWRASDQPENRQGRRFSFPDSVRIKRLDGAQWISSDHPLLPLLSTHFMPVSGSNCIAPLKLRSTSRYRRTSPAPQPRSHLCAMKSVGRVWEGYEDLSVSIDAQTHSKKLFIDLWVRDSDLSRGDVVWLWFGDPKRPIEVKLTERGAIGREAIKLGLKLNWIPLAEHRRHLIAPSPESAGGYFVHIELPLSATRRHLSIAVDDQDRAFPSASQRLVVVGTPRADVLGEGHLPPEPLPFDVP